MLDKFLLNENKRRFMPALVDSNISDSATSNYTSTVPWKASVAEPVIMT